MCSRPSRPSRCHTAIGSLLVIGLLVIASDVMITAGLARDVIAAVGQHVVLLSTIRGARSAPMHEQESGRVRSCSRRGGFPALRDNAALKSVTSGRITIY
jgi:hypothetical protein